MTKAQANEPRAGSRRVRRVTRLSGWVVLGLLSACSVGPDYVPPEPQVPDAWHQELAKGLQPGEDSLGAWWEVFEDPVLDDLIRRSLDGNLDLRAAWFRIAEARAFRGVAASEFWPGVDATGDYARSRVSEEIQPVIPPGSHRTSDFFKTGFDVSWEIDVFGGIRRSVESADAGLEASVESYRDLIVLLMADVAANYIEVRTLQERLRLALANVDAQRGTLQLTQDRLNAQLVPSLDVRQAELNLAATESVVPSLRIALTQRIHRLSILVGAPPSELYDELGQPDDIPTLPAEVLVGVPTNLLRQRPDVRRAERELAAQHARIGVAKSDLFPKFYLLGAFNLEATDFGNLWDWSSRAYSFGPSIRWAIFQGGRIRNAIRAEDARTRAALAGYEQSVLLALEEVENAMVGYAQELDRRDALERAATAAEASVELVKTLYRTGLTDFQNVLDSERSLFQQQDQLALSRGLVVQNLIQLYRSLGGGWRSIAPEEEPAEEDRSEEAPQP